MADEASFRVKLVDDSSGAARTAARSFGELADQVTRTEKAVEDFTRDATGRLRDARRNFVSTGKSIRAELRQTERAVTALNSPRILGGHRVTMRLWGNSLRPVQRGMGRLTVGLEDAVGGMLNFGSAGAVIRTLGIAAAATAGAYAMGRLAEATARTAVEYAVFGERARLALGQLAPDGDTGEGLLELSKELSGRFGMDLRDTTESLQKLLASQFSTALSTDIIKMGADLRAIGAGAEDVKSAVVAISQIKGAGRLMGQELLQLANAGVSIELIRKEIGKLMGGKSVEEVIKLQEAGEIDADTAIQGILNAVKKKTGVSALGEAGERFANSTIEGMVGRAKARGQLAALQIGDAVAGPLNKFVSRNLVRLDEFLASPEGMKKIEDFGNLLASTFQVAGELLEEFGEGFLRTFSQFDGIDGGRSVLEAWSDPATKQAVMEFGESIGTLAYWIGELGATISKWSATFFRFADLALLLNPITFLPAATWKVGSFFSEEAAARDSADQERTRRIQRNFGGDQELVAANDNGRRLGESFGQGMASGISSQRGNVWAEADRLAMAAVEGSRAGMDAHSPSRETFRLGGDFGDGLIGGVKAKLPEVVRAANDIAMAPVSAAAGSLSGVGRGAAAPASGGTTTVDVGGISIPITANGASPQELEEIRRVVRQEMTRFFDGLAQTGS